MSGRWDCSRQGAQSRNLNSAASVTKSHPCCSKPTRCTSQAAAACDSRRWRCSLRCCAARHAPLGVKGRELSDEAAVFLSMDLSIHLFVCLSASIYPSKSIWLSNYQTIYRSIYLSILLSSLPYMHMYTHTHSHTCVYMYIYIYVYIHYIHIHTYTHTHIYIDNYTCVSMLVCIVN